MWIIAAWIKQNKKIALTHFVLFVFQNPITILEFTQLEHVNLETVVI